MKVTINIVIEYTLNENQSELAPMPFESSNGTLLVNRDGTIHEDSDIDDWLVDIDRVDVVELDNYYSSNGLGICGGGDALDFAYWDRDQKYHLPDRNWRLDTFHPQVPKRTISQIVELVDESFKWIKENRNLSS